MNKSVKTTLASQSLSFMQSPYPRDWQVNFTIPIRTAAMWHDAAYGPSTPLPYSLSQAPAFLNTGSLLF